MIKKLLLLTLLAAAFVACKKEKKVATPKFDLTGDWTLQSYQTNFGSGGGVTASATAYPCMVNNIFTFYSDSTSSQSYIGTDTCFITPTHSLAAGARFYGSPPVGKAYSTWKIKGSSVFITYVGKAKSVPGAITSVNNKLQIAFKDTSVIGTNTYYTNSVMIKK